MSDTKTVKVGQYSVDLVLPDSFALRNEIVIAAGTNWQRASFAALGVCWKGKGRPKALYEATYSPHAYGGQVIDELHKRGVPMGEARTAALEAFAYLADSLPKEEEVDEAAKGFPEGEAADSTSSPPTSG